MKIHALYVSSKLYPQRGLSLIELMISLTIGMLLLLGITALIVQQSQTRTELEKSSRQIENGRYAIQILHDDIEHAGYYDKYFNIPQASAVLAATPLPDPCSTVATDLEAAMSLPVQGYDLSVSPPTGAAFTCKLDGVNSASNANNHRPGTDILVIRRVATNTTPKASAVAGQYYLQATPAEHLLATGTNTSVFTLTNNTTNDKSEASLRAYLTRIYFISPCSIPAGGGTSCTGAADDDGRPIPTLKRLELSSVGGAPTFTMTRLVEGIENMQLDYGLDADLDGYPDNNYATVPATSEEWSNVMTVRVNLLARNTECTTGHTDTKSYNLGAAGTFTAPASICPNGDFKRHVFTELVRVINPSGRRSQE
ncbi:MAG: PilW family protein [Gallionellaceae bacterium]|jgi:type IV pilus assembly protein PilW